MERYQYNTLPGKDYIRTLTLFPGDKDTVPRCHISAVPFNQVEDNYEALSYCWGDSNNKVDIICNERRLAVTANLYDALQALRDAQKPRVLWVDAMCINQTDNAEKSHQVRSMDKIYKNARAVPVWLGKDDEEIAEDCFKLVRETVNHMGPQLEQLEEYGITGVNWSLAPAVTICNDGARWAKVKTLTDLPWFSRVWVVQEVALAKTCSLRWGHHELNIADLVELCCWNEARPDIKSVTGGWGSGMLLNLFDDFYATYGNSNSWTTSKPLLRYQMELGRANIDKICLSGLLRSSGTINASDPRDHIYAFLGHPLASTASGLIIEPDYGKPLVDVYTDAAFSLLQHPREGPGILTSVVHTTSDDVEGQVFPSWVPRWDENTAVKLRLLATGYAWYAAGGSDLAPSRMDEYKVLTILGIAFETVTWVSQPFRMENLDFDIDKWEDRYRNTRVSFIDNLWQELLTMWDGSQDEFEHMFSVALVREYPGNKHGIGPRHRNQFLAYRHTIYKALDQDHYSPFDDKEFTGYAEKYLICMKTAYNRSLVLTKAGRMGMVPPCTRPGDMCFVIPGMAVPLVLRPKVNGRYNLVGDSYIYGVMRGEVITAVTEGEMALSPVIIE
ncbi:HET-domain-containing protein [Stipitochalara longipes BDJ]|nr:HET-domain-containing protein [Stipitochalara longipes BDJ]